MCQHAHHRPVHRTLFQSLLLTALLIHDPLTVAQTSAPNGGLSPLGIPPPPPPAGNRVRQPRDDGRVPQPSPNPAPQPSPQTAPLTSQTPPANNSTAAAGDPISPSTNADPMAGQPLGDGELECTVGTAPSTTDWSAPLCEWVGDQSCSGCGSKCVINRGVMSIGFEVIGSTLERRDVMSAIIMCPALSLIARYGEGMTQKTADMSCPSQGELASFPNKLNSKTPLALLKRWPHISKRIHDLVNANAVDEYIKDNCRQESLTFQPMIQVFAGLWGITPQATGNSSSPICGDLAGNWLQMYVAESQCIASPSARDDVRSCLGDDSKWLDTKCVFYYLDIALGRTRESVKAEQYGPRYINALRSLATSCTQRTTKADCESDAKDRQTGKVWETLVGPKGDRQKLWNAMAAATPSYGTPDDNLIKPGEPNPLQVWLSAAPGGSAMIAVHVTLLAALVGVILAW